MMSLRVIALCAWLLLPSWAGAASWTLVASNTAQASTVNLSGIGAGQLIAVRVSHEGAPTSITVSDGTSSLTGLTKKNHSNSDISQQVFYLLSSVATGSVTYTVTWGTSPPFQKLAAYAFSYTGTAAFDAELTGGGDEYNVTGGTAPTGDVVSSTLTTTGTDELVLGYTANYSGNPEDTWLINGAAATGNLSVGNSSEWYGTANSTFTGGVGVHYATTSVGLISAVAFTATAGGGGCGLTQNLMGVGC